MNINKLIEKDINLALDESKKLFKDNEKFDITLDNFLRISNRAENGPIKSCANCYDIGRLSGYYQALEELKAEKKKDKSLDKLLNFDEINFDKLSDDYKKLLDEKIIKEQFDADNLIKIITELNKDSLVIAFYCLTLGFLKGYYTK